MLATIGQRRRPNRWYPTAGRDGLCSNNRVMRAFGYFFQTPAVSPRVQRETAAVLADFAPRLEP